MYSRLADLMYRELLHFKSQNLKKEIAIAVYSLKNKITIVQSKIRP